MITVTDKAKEYLDQVRNDDYVTLGVKGGGCSGFTYVWDFKNNWPDVQWSDPYAAALVHDPMAEMFVAGCTIDYVTELGGAYLKVPPPPFSVPTSPPVKSPLNDGFCPKLKMCLELL